MLIKGKCECGAQLDIELDVGWDVDGEGEDRQHLQRCLRCKKSRLVFETKYHDGRVPSIGYGGWKND